MFIEGFQEKRFLIYSKMEDEAVGHDGYLGKCFFSIGFSKKYMSQKSEHITR